MRPGAGVGAAELLGQLAQAARPRLVRDAADARDNTTRNCGSLGCTQLLTTDALSVARFEDPAAQQRYVASFGDDAHAEGAIVLQYAAARTPVAKRAAYEKRLRKFLAK